VGKTIKHWSAGNCKRIEKKMFVEERELQKTYREACRRPIGGL
jgi:hypothetical protein